MTDIARVLFVGQLIGHSRWRFDAFGSLGLECQYLNERTYFDETSWRKPLQKVEFHAKHGPRIARWNRVVQGAVEEYEPDVVWVDKGLFLTAETVRRLRGRTRAVVHCFHDDFRYPLYQGSPFDQAIPEYDLHLVTRPVNVDELYERGARKVDPFLFSFEPTVHRPATPPEADLPEVIFIGHFEKGRDQLLAAAASTGASVGVWGPMWGRRQQHAIARVAAPVEVGNVVRGEGLWGDDYAGAFSGGRISLGLLSRWMRDEHTCRTMEIPACGGLLLAERTPEHLRLFEEGKEAVFFGDGGELTEAVDVLNRDEALRQQIAKAGRERAHRSGYDHRSEAQRHIDRIREVLR